METTNSFSELQEYKDIELGACYECQHQYVYHGEKPEHRQCDEQNTIRQPITQVKIDCLDYKELHNSSCSEIIHDREFGGVLQHRIVPLHYYYVLPA